MLWAQWTATFSSSRTSSQWSLKNLYVSCLPKDYVPTYEDGHHQVLGAEEVAAHQGMAYGTIMVLLPALL